MAVKNFKRDLRHSQVKALCECFQEFNAAGGAVLPLQTGKVLPPMRVLHKMLTTSTFDEKCLTYVLFTVATMCLPQALLNKMELRRV